MARNVRNLVLAFVMVLVSHPPLVAQSTETPSPEEMVRQVFLTWSDHEVDRLDALFADDFVSQLRHHLSAEPGA